MNRKEVKLMSPVPTLKEVFGTDAVWVTDPLPAEVGPSATYPVNNLYFATPAAAAIVAKMLGGTLEKANSITSFGPFRQNQPNLMVRMPPLDNEDVGRLINCGYIASLFTNGYSMPYIEMCIGMETGTAYHFPA
jgi:hypothetical protein